MKDLIVTVILCIIMLLNLADVLTDISLGVPTWHIIEECLIVLAAGVTAGFNRNLLVRINRELGGNFDPSAFTHRAIYNRERHRIEMHLVSRKAQTVRILGQRFNFRAGESIHTENSYKYSLNRFTALAKGAGWQPRAAWTDAEGLFSVHALVASD